MNRKDTFLIALMLLTMAMLISLVPAACAGDEAAQTWVARIVSLQGRVELKRPDSPYWEPAYLNCTLKPATILRTGLGSRATILLPNDAVIRLDQETSIVFSTMGKKHPSILRLLKGAANFFSRFTRSLKIDTPFVNAAVEGTEFVVRVTGNDTMITVFKGRVRASNPLGTLLLGQGQSTIAKKGQAPVLRILARPRDTVQWSLYYPPVLDFHEFGQDKALAKPLLHALTMYLHGNVSNALSLLNQVPDDERDLHFFILRAGILLWVGQAGAADSDIGKALDIDPACADALALRAVIEVTRNEPLNSLKLARQAIAVKPDSVSAYIALSYALQANFELYKALEALRAAVDIAPNSALAWARLSELWLATGNLDRCLDAAKRAASLNPELARIQTVLGFAHMVQLNIKAAKKAFEHAIELDSADPMPRLGLGLTLIRQGHIRQGRQQIEIAVALDPGNAIIRSYLGKAYYTEHRISKALEQLAMAKELDPKDPTPWFYQAILEQSTNRPVEALHDLQRSIMLNDNRAVYRSRMLLDQDLGARSAGLARIYNDLGFEQLALSEAWKSLEISPESYPAHRFLADSYSALPRHEIARVSELLQSQLLQPVNIIPIQPQLAESKHYIFVDTGPSEPSLNEYSPLFLSNRLALQANGLIGGRGTLGDELVQSGLIDRFSYSLGQFHYEGNGFRRNDDQHHDIYNAFAQVSLSAFTSAQMEYRRTLIKKGDLFLRFQPDDYLPDLRSRDRKDSIRLGLRHNFSPGSILLTSLIYADWHWRKDVFAGFTGKGREKGMLAELQHQYRLSSCNLIYGVGWFSANPRETVTFWPYPSEKERDTISQLNMYIYPQLHINRRLDLTLGLSADFYRGTIEERKQLNPKLGIMWTPTTGTTIRATVFRVLKRMLVTDQTIEPTQVAGFNQFFDDEGGTDSWHYGIGIDQRIHSSLYGGAEFSWRRLKVPYMDALTLHKKHAHWWENSGRAYLYWTPSNQVVLGAQYLYERFKRNPKQPGEEDIVSSRTHRVPLSVGIFLPNGLGGRITSTYVYQAGRFGNFNEGIYRGSSRFWVTDLSVRYRITKRRGLIELKAKNLFDRRFRFQDTDPANPTICPKRLIIARLILWF